MKFKTRLRSPRLLVSSMDDGKRQTSSSSSPLSNATLLFQILSYVGPGQHFFVSTVCKLWHESNAAVSSLEVTSLVTDPDVDYDEAVRKFLCTPQMTLYSAVFASVARVRLAFQHPTLRLECWKLQHIAGRVADVATLQVALNLGLGSDGMASNDMLTGAAYAGSISKLSLIEAFMQSNEKLEIPNNICAYAASSGSVEALKWVAKWGLLHTHSVLSQAAHFGHVNLLEYMHSEHDCELHDELLPAAARNGHHDAVEWLFDHGAPCSLGTICGDAAESGDLELVHFVHSKGGEINGVTMADAAKSGHLALCQQLHSEQCPLDVDAVFGQPTQVTLKL
jgi:hypothetical protein